MTTQSAKAGNFQVSDQLAAISFWNPGITLTDGDVRRINDNQLVLVGLGSIVAQPQQPQPGLPTLTRKGCIERLFYGTGSADLDYIWIDSALYSPDNLKDFREILEKAAFHMKCINFCYDKTNNTMRMLNVYPQCCCKCEETK